MRDEDQGRFAQLITGVADYYGKALGEPVINLYWEGLKQFDLGAVERALWQHTQNPDAGQYMPKISDVVKMIGGGTLDQAMVAWAKVDKAIRQVGTYTDVVFDDAIIHRVISDLGGWVWLGSQTEHEWPFICKRFEASYRAYKLRGDTDAYPSVLIGMANAQNAFNGFDLQPPALIGNPVLAKLVMEGGTDKPMLAVTRAGEVAQGVEKIGNLQTVVKKIEG